MSAEHSKLLLNKLRLEPNGNNPWVVSVVSVVTRTGDLAEPGSMAFLLLASERKIT
jgi:hypothetical protein